MAEELNQWICNTIPGGPLLKSVFLGGRNTRRIWIPGNCRSTSFNGWFQSLSHIILFIVFLLLLVLLKVTSISYFFTFLRINRISKSITSHRFVIVLFTKRFNRVAFTDEEIVFSHGFCQSSSEQQRDDDQLYISWFPSLSNGSIHSFPPINLQNDWPVQLPMQHLSSVSDLSLYLSLCSFFNHHQKKSGCRLWR